MKSLRVSYPESSYELQHRTGSRPDSSALPWLMTSMTLFRPCAAACAIAARTWKDGVIITFYRKADPTNAVNHRGIILLAVSGKRSTCMFARRLKWLLAAIFVGHQYGFHPYRGGILSLSILQRLIKSSGMSNSGFFAVYVDLGQCFDRIP